MPSRVILPRPARESLEHILKDLGSDEVQVGITGNNARLVAAEMGVKPILEVKALQAGGLSARKIRAGSVLALGHENMYYLELESEGTVTFFLTVTGNVPPEAVRSGTSRQRGWDTMIGSWRRWRCSRGGRR